MSSRWYKIILKSNITNNSKGYNYLNNDNDNDNQVIETLLNENSNDFIDDINNL